MRFTTQDWLWLIVVAVLAIGWLDAERRKSLAMARIQNLEQKLSAEHPTP
jgi:hypothetical protein